MQLDKGNIARWNFYTTGINANLSEPWLKVKANTQFSNCIVLARSKRYNNPLIDYSFLSAYTNIVFVGVKAEHDLMKKSIPNLFWQQVGDSEAIGHLVPE